MSVSSTLAESLGDIPPISPRFLWRVHGVRGRNVQEVCTTCFPTIMKRVGVRTCVVELWYVWREALEAMSLIILSWGTQCKDYKFNYRV